MSAFQAWHVMGTASRPARFRISFSRAISLFLFNSRGLWSVDTAADMPSNKKVLHNKSNANRLVKSSPLQLSCADGIAEMPHQL